MKLMTMKSKTIAIATLILSLTLPAMTAHADRRGNQELDRRRGDRNRSRVVTYELNQIDVRQINETGKLGLKQALRNSGQRLERNARLLDVEIIGRATGRMSLVSLKIDGAVVDSRYLERQGRDRGDRRRPPRDRRRSILLQNNRPRQSDGPWRLIAERDTRIRRVVVTVRNAGRNNQASQISLGTKKVTKFIGRSVNFQVNQRGVVSVSLKAHHNDIDVSQVVIYFRNGRSEVLRGLHGYIRHGRTLTSRINAQSQVQSISVQAYSPSVVGSTGRLEALVAVQGRGRR